MCLAMYMQLKFTASTSIATTQTSDINSNINAAFTSNIPVTRLAR